MEGKKSKGKVSNPLSGPTDFSGSCGCLKLGRRCLKLSLLKMRQKGYFWKFGPRNCKLVTKTVVSTLSGHIWNLSLLSLYLKALFRKALKHTLMYQWRQWDFSTFFEFSTYLLLNPGLKAIFYPGIPTQQLPLAENLQRQNLALKEYSCHRNMFSLDIGMMYQKYL